MKLHRQIARFGSSSHGVPPLEVSRGTDGELVINNGVTRATRIAKLSPGTTVRVEVIDGTDGGAIWDVEDEQLLAAARRLIERNRGRITGAPSA